MVPLPSSLAQPAVSATTSTIDRSPTLITTHSCPRKAQRLYRSKPIPRCAVVCVKAYGFERDRSNLSPLAWRPVVVRAELLFGVLDVGAVRAGDVLGQRDRTG